jgi:dolichol-phosphate mannosyltransferase
MFDERGSLTISLTSRCRRRRSWCSRPFPFPGGTATSVGLARATSGRLGTSLPEAAPALSFHSFHLSLAFPQFRPRGTISRLHDSQRGLAHSRRCRYRRQSDEYEGESFRPQSSVIARIRDESAVSVPSALPTEGVRKLLISLATYNEAGNLRPLVETIRQFAPNSSILVIDDNSPDGTGRIADEIRDNLPNVHVLHRPGKLGLGTATLAAVRYAIDHQFDFLLNLDADFSHPPRFIPDLLNGMADHDVMIGSRYVPGGGVEGGFNLKRKLMSSGINGYARLLLGLTSRDNSGAFRCYRVSKLAEIDLDLIRSRGYSFQEEILYWCKSVGSRIGETPILFENRRAGTSKINMREALSALAIILQLGLDRATGRTSKKRGKENE